MSVRRSIVLAALVFVCDVRLVAAQAAAPADVPPAVAIPNRTAPNSAIVPYLEPRDRSKHEDNVAIAKRGDAELLLMGDSITENIRRRFGRYAGKPVFDKHFNRWKIANFGIAGDKTQGVLYRLRNGEGQGFRPRAVIVMIGTNNIGRNSPAEIAEGIGAVVLELQRDFPEAKILLLGILPRGAANGPERKKILDINTTIAKLHDGKRVYYLDIGGRFLDPDGNIPNEVMPDGLHPSSLGYEIWAQAVKQPLSQLMAK